MLSVREAGLHLILRSVFVRFFGIFLLLLLPQLPFLTADADIHLSTSRAPWTDEGLYTLQSRNAVVTGHFDMNTSDGAIKEPIFAGIVWMASKMSADTMPRMRFIFLLLIAGSLSGFACGSSLFGQLTRHFLIPLGYFNYYIFNYSHLAMAEISCCILILGGIWALYGRLSGGSAWTLAAANLSMAFCYAVKIQFWYAALIPPMTFAIAITLLWCSGLSSKLSAQVARLTRDLLASVLYAGAGGGIFAAAWVLPNWSIFHWVLSGQSANQFGSISQTRWEVENHILSLLGDVRAWPILLPAMAGGVAVFLTWRATAGNAEARLRLTTILAPALAFVLLELHKFLLLGLPSRYLLSWFVSVVVLTAAASTAYLSLGIPRVQRKTAIVAWVGVALTVNLLFDATAYSQRSFAIHDAQVALAADPSWRGKVVVGAWAATLFWGSGAVAYPVWKDYFNDQRILSRFHPAAIVSEPHEEDSVGAFAADGIDLGSAATKVSIVKVAKWDVGIYFLPATLQQR